MAADYSELGDVAGRAVLVEWTSWPGFAIFEAAARGASAIIFYDYPGRSLDDALKQNTVIYHDAIPSVGISIADASGLKRRLGAGPVELELENRVDSELGESENVLGVLEGTDVAGEWVAATAHHDRWFRGAQDDAVGVAVVLELARVISARPTPPRRSHLFVSFGSEETGAADAEFDWLRGSHAFVRAHPEITSRLAYVFNVDGAGWPAERGYFYGTLEASAFHRKLLSDIGLSDRVTLRPGVTDWVDAWTLAAVGGASAGYLLWFEAHGKDGPDAFSPYYHTQQDRISAGTYGNLPHDLRLAALTLLRVDAAEALPFDLGEVARFVLEALEDVRRADVLGESVAEAERWTRALETTEVAGAYWRTRNIRLMRARRELVPWLFSLSSEGAVMKTSPYLSDFLALRRARESVERGVPATALEALREVSTMSWGARLSSAAYRAERQMSFGASDWSSEFDQSPEPAAYDVHALYLSLDEGGAWMRAASSACGLSRSKRWRSVERRFSSSPGSSRRPYPS
ncbi:MAG TPA: M28 family peptidase [Vicinamibacteria bacterium]|nr:M28 family peptidase [Vicinamibacteria bacterium]